MDTHAGRVAVVTDAARGIGKAIAITPDPLGFAGHVDILVNNAAVFTAKEIANKQAIKRIGTAQDVVGTVCFLSSEDSAFMTGQTLATDGGLMRV